jgi:hypothetical protein
VNEPVIDKDPVNIELPDVIRPADVIVWVGMF